MVGWMENEVMKNQIANPGHNNQSLPELIQASILMNAKFGELAGFYSSSMLAVGKDGRRLSTHENSGDKCTAHAHTTVEICFNRSVIFN